MCQVGALSWCLKKLKSEKSESEQEVAGQEPNQVPAPNTIYIMFLVHQPAQLYIRPFNKVVSAAVII